MQESGTSLSYWENKDLPGNNYRYFDLKQGETCQTCIDACLKDLNCKAYTYKKPGFQASYGRCILKSGAADPVDNNNCISGVKILVFNDNTQIAFRCKNYLKIPGQVIGLSNFAKEGTKFTPQNYINVKETKTIDAHDNSWIGLNFYMLPSRDDDDPYAWTLPQGIAVGLIYSALDWKEKVFGYWADYGPNSIGGDRFKKEHGGDILAPSGTGWYWYESTGLDFSDWNMIQCLPRGAVVGLKHSANQRDKNFVWQGITYDASDPDISPPQGFLRRHYGDMGTMAGCGYSWYEKITDPPKN